MHRHFECPHHQLCCVPKGIFVCVYPQTSVFICICDFSSLCRFFLSLLMLRDPKRGKQEGRGLVIDEKNASIYSNISIYSYICVRSTEHESNMFVHLYFTLFGPSAKLCLMIGVHVCIHERIQ